MDALTLALAARVPAAARGDREAFAAIVDDTRSVVSSIALAIVRDVELSRDVAQDVFLAAWRDLAQLRDPHSLLPWLRQLTRHRAYHVLRTERRRLKRIDDRDLDALLDAAVDPQPDAGDRMLAREEQRLLEAVLDELPDDARDVVTLYYREGRSTSHVAALLGLTEATVRQRLSRARALMRADLLDRYGRVASRTAPNAAFTAAVLGALTIAAPGVSSAVTLAAAASGTSWVAKLAMAGGGAALGAVGGIAGVVFGARRLQRDARSREERAALRRFELTSIILVLVAAAMFPIAWRITHHAASQVAVFAGFIVGLAVLHGCWLPRIVRQRHALEALEDPARAARARARERRAAMLGWTAGLISGGAGLIAGLLL